MPSPRRRRRRSRWSTRCTARSSRRWLSPRCKSATPGPAATAGPARPRSSPTSTPPRPSDGRPSSSAPRFRSSSFSFPDISQPPPPVKGEVSGFVIRGLSLMDVRAAVAWEAGKPLSIEKVQLAGPKAGEVLVEIKATGICHTDAFTRSGGDPEGLFPSILGHEGAGIVVDVGPGVATLRKGDHVIPLYTPECRVCKSCLSRKTNLCTAIRGTQGKGVMPDGTSRFSIGGKPIHHYMGCSTFANFTVLPEIALAKIREDAPFDKVCYIGCGVTTGIGAVINTAKVEAGANVVVFGLGGIGLNVVQGARMVGAGKIIGVDINDKRKGIATNFGMTH